MKSNKFNLCEGQSQVPPVHLRTSALVHLILLDDFSSVA